MSLDKDISLSSNGGSPRRSELLYCSAFEVVRHRGRLRSVLSCYRDLDNHGAVTSRIVALP